MMNENNFTAQVFEKQKCIPLQRPYMLMISTLFDT
jgi:hypothetical protein